MELDVQLCQLEKKEFHLVQGATRQQAWSDPDDQELKLESVPSSPIATADYDRKGGDMTLTTQVTN